jgi:hypothetical protein
MSNASAKPWASDPPALAAADRPLRQSRKQISKLVDPATVTGQLQWLQGRRQARLLGSDSPHGTVCYTRAHAAPSHLLSPQPASHLLASDSTDE